MLGKLIQKLGEKAQQREIDDFLSRMRQMDSDELGFTAAITYEWASTLRSEYGWDLFDPWSALRMELDLPVKVGKIVRDLQQQGEIGAAKASGLIVWAHTIRGTVNPKLRGDAREIWGHLRRGFPFAQKAADDFFISTMTMCDLQRLGEFPDGFTPEVR